MLAKTGLRFTLHSWTVKGFIWGVNILAMKLGDSFKCALKVHSKLLSVFVKINWVKKHQRALFTHLLSSVQQWKEMLWLCLICPVEIYTYRLTLWDTIGKLLLVNSYPNVSQQFVSINQLTPVSSMPTWYSEWLIYHVKGCIYALKNQNYTLFPIIC